MRLQKFIAASGACSRREAEVRIQQGRVTINGRTAKIGDCTEDPADVICMDGKPVDTVREHTYILLNKPRGYVTTMRDEKGRPTVAELVGDVGVRVFPVGRLDCMSEGLLLMTDDGTVANLMAHPSHGVRKTYRVWVSGSDFVAAGEKMAAGLTYEGVRYRGAQVRMVKDEGEKAILDITVGEGKNHEVRNLCAACDLRVHRLMRIRQGELLLGTLPIGSWRHLTDSEVRFLQNLS